MFTFPLGNTYEKQTKEQIDALKSSTLLIKQERVYF